MATQTKEIITRSEATLLVEFYYFSNLEILETEIEDKDDKETIKNFTKKCHDEGLLADIPSARVKNHSATLFCDGKFSRVYIFQGYTGYS